MLTLLLLCLHVGVYRNTTIQRFHFKIATWWLFHRDAGDSLTDCRILFVSEIYKIEEAGSSEGPGATSDSPLKSKLLIFQYSFLALIRCLNVK